LIVGTDVGAVIDAPTATVQAVAGSEISDV
jgi:hypothetical protein